MRPRTLLHSIFSMPISTLAISGPPAHLLTLTNGSRTLAHILDPQCVRISDPPMVGLNPSMCHVGIQIICAGLADRPVRDTWIWSELVGCALGYYLPRRAAVPYLGQCQSHYLEVVEQCAMDSRWNAGSSNVQEMPGFSGDGQPFMAGLIRYAMAPERLTLPFHDST